MAGCRHAGVGGQVRKREEVEETEERRGVEERRGEARQEKGRGAERGADIGGEGATTGDGVPIVVVQIASLSGDRGAAMRGETATGAGTGRSGWEERRGWSGETGEWTETRRRAVAGRQRRAA